MSSVARVSGPKSHIPVPKHNIKSVLGFGAVSKSSGPSNPYFSNAHNYPARKSVDNARSHKQGRRQRADRSSVSEASSTIDSADTTPKLEKLDPIIAPMNFESSNVRPRRPPVRVDAQEGPWSVSVAETPHDASSYSLYIKSQSSLLVFSFQFPVTSFLPCGSPLRHIPAGTSLHVSSFD
jgi:serum/glucocorticoid-regulated kinase 2